MFTRQFTRGIAATMFLLLTVLSPFLALYHASAKFIDTAGHNGVIIDCPTYFAGTKNINVYSNKTVQNYELRLNGTLLNSAAHPRQFINGRWYAGYETLVQGENQAGNLRYCDVQDTNYLYCQSQTVAVAWLLGIPVDWDEFIDQRIYFGTGMIDTTYINATWLEWRIQLTRESSVNDKVIQYWRTSDSTWQTLATLTENAWASGNVSCSAIANLGSIDKAFTLRVYCRDSNANDEMQINIDYFRIYYTTTQVLSNNRDYNLVDTYAFNSVLKSDGKYNLTARIKDFGGTWWNDMKWIWVDNTKPTISTITVTAHPAGGLNNTVPISVTATISDTFLNNSYGQYSNGYNTIQVPNAVSTNFNYTSYFTNRTYNFYIYATDHAGNVQTANKSFTVYYKQDILYIKNPIITVTADKNQYINNTAWVNTTCQFVGQLKVYVNGTLNSTHDSPSSVNKSFYYSTTKTLVVVLRFTYTNGTFFRNITNTIRFINPTYVYINRPLISIKAQEKNYVNETAWVNSTCQYAGQLKIYVNGTLNQTINSPSTVSKSFVYHVPQTLQITLRLTYINGTFFQNFSVTVRFIPPTYIYVQNPSISVSSQRYQYVTHAAWVNTTCQKVGELKVFVNGTLNSTHASPTSVNKSFSSSTLKTLVVTLRFTYTNGTFFQNISVIVQFINYTYVLVHEPTVAIGASLKCNITETNYIIVIAEHLGKMNFTLHSEYNDTTSITQYNDTSTPLIIPVMSYIVDTWNCTLTFYYPNDTYYNAFSIGISFDDWTIVHEYIHEPLIGIVYNAKNNITSTSYVNVTCQYIGELKFYVNGTYNSTFSTPTQVNFDLTSGTVQTFNITIEAFYENSTFFKNFTAIVEFYNATTIINNIYILEPIVNIVYTGFQNITHTAWVNITCERIGQMKFYVNSTLNETYNSPSDIHFNINSSTMQEFDIVIESFYENMTFYKNFSLVIYFFNGTKLIIVIFEPTIVISYNSLQNITRIAWVNISCENVGRIKVFINDTLNSTTDDPSSITLGLNSSTPQGFNITVQSFYLNLSHYQNFTFLVQFYNGSIVYINQPLVEIAYQAMQNITHPANVNITCNNVGRIKIYLNGTINATYDDPVMIGYCLNSSIVQTFNVTVSIFYQNLTFYQNRSFLVEFFNGTQIIIHEPVFNFEYQTYQNITDTAWINITCARIGRVKFYLDGSLNQTVDSPGDHVDFGVNATVPHVFNIVLQTYYENLTFFKNYTATIQFFNWTIIQTVYEPWYFIKAQTLQNITHAAWVNITCNYISLLKIYVNGTLNQTYNTPVNENFSLYSAVPSNHVLNLLFYNLTGFMFKNESLNVEFVNASFVEHYIFLPSINLQYQATQNITSSAWLNMTCQQIGRIKLYINNTLNSTYDDPSIINFEIKSSTVQAFNITVQSFYQNLSWYQNYTVFISIINMTKITQLIHEFMPVVDISYISELYFDHRGWVNISCDHVGRIKIYVNNTLNSSTDNPNTINMDLGIPNVERMFNVTINIFYENLTFFKNYTAIISFINYTYIDNYIINPAIVVLYDHQQLIGNFAYINATCSNIGKINLYINNTFNQTYNNPTSISFNVNYSVPISFNFTLETFYNNNSFYQNITGNIVYFDYSYVQLHNPFIVISYANQTRINEIAQASFVLNYVSQMNLYINGTFNSTYLNPSSLLFNITSPVISTFVLKVELFDENLTFFNNLTFTMAFVNFTLQITHVYIPSITVVYPSVIAINSVNNMTISTGASAGFKLKSWKNGVYINTTNYVGNQTFNINLPSNDIGNLTYEIELFTNENISYSNFTIVIYITPKVLPVINYYIEISIEDDGRLLIDFWSENTSHADFYLDNVLMGTIDGNKSGVLRSAKVLKAGSAHTVNYEIFNVLGQLEIADENRITVPPSGGGGGGGIIDFFTGLTGPSSWFWIILILIILTILAVLTRRRQRKKKRQKRKR